MTAQPPAAAPATLDGILDGAAPLPHLGVIRAEGEDAASFLHGQLTNDFLLLREDQARLAGWLSAKGRLQASFVGFKRGPNEILLVASRDLIAATVKRLSMYVLRAKAKLSDASDAFTLLGLAGSAVPGGARAPWTLAADGQARIVHLYRADGTPRALWIAPAGTPQPAGAGLAEDRWRWGEVRSGVAASTTAAVADAFVPQMLNYESVGGVNFKKGCYPGQEVVARSQFRGTLKRRTYLVHAAAPLAAGAEVFAADDPQQPAGTVVEVAPAPAELGGGWDALVSLQVSAAQAGGLRTGGDAAATALELRPLPYALLEDI
ncbi:CAF17-like 4Fe-4S cluster assembly/insertion protein YgfZ [Xylophilus sp.]|uniref:CAF17-like 4Fe-4S cluster assembly/insertion protein YgfZ n=1 Tax=Xylophilus sp. TaxID=2653893 RepID=UPI0013B95C41|nr:folate-binding protein [Xylophilus sp.]KAF1048705.1 MAG: tRNA-modifying protein YgfZ [Xylophilus sp.]